VSARRRRPVPELVHYRDDGPLVEALARPLADRPGPAIPLTAVALLPLAVVLLLPALGAGRVATAVALAVAVLVAAPAGALARRRPHTGRLDWLVPPVLRLAEYAALLRLTGATADGTVPACYALLAALAYHHYDVVYRLRDRGEDPPGWLRRFGLGWEGRLLVAAVLVGLDVLRPGLFVLAAVLGVVYVVEGVLGWVRSERAPVPGPVA